MQDMKLEVELSYITSVSQLLTKRSVTGVKWMHGKVGVADEDMWFPSEEGWDIIPLKSIEMVGRQLTGSVGNQILQATKYSNHLVIDYKKQSLFGTGYVTSTMILAGRGQDIRKMKNYLLSALGFKIDASFGELEQEESRLLCLLASGMDNVDVLLPIFDGNKVLLKHAFVVLKKRKLVDDYASPTQLGLEYVEQVKGKGGGKLGSDIDKAFGEVAKTWKHVDQLKSTKRMNKVLWKHGDSSLAGRVATDELWRFIPIADIDEMEMEEMEMGTLRLHIHTKHDVSLYIEPVDKSTIFVLYGVLDKKEGTQLRILGSIYMGIEQRDIITHILDIQPFLLDPKLNQMAADGLIDSDNKLLSEGIGKIKEVIHRKTSESAGQPEVVERLEELKLQEASKKVHEKLGGL